ITKQYLQKVYPTKGKSYVCSNVKVTPISGADVVKRCEKYRQEAIKRIGLIGSLDVNYKGHDVALKVLQKLIYDFGLTEIFIDFVGAGDSSRWLELADSLGVKDHVIFKGSIPPGDHVMKWIDSIDILLQPSKTEAQGRAIIEAMSRGCPVVASN